MTDTLPGEADAYRVLVALMREDDIYDAVVDSGTEAGMLAAVANSTQNERLRMLVAGNPRTSRRTLRRMLAHAVDPHTRAHVTVALHDDLVELLRQHCDRPSTEDVGILFAIAESPRASPEILAAMALLERGRYAIPVVNHPRTTTKTLREIARELASTRPAVADLSRLVLAARADD